MGVARNPTSVSDLNYETLRFEKWNHVADCGGVCVAIEPIDR